MAGLRLCCISNAIDPAPLKRDVSRRTQQMEERAKILSLMAAVLTSSSAHQHPPVPPGSESGGRVIVGYILGAGKEQLEHIDALIQKSGIHAALDGSLVYDVWVPCNERVRAMEIFTQDASTNRYRFEVKQ